MLFFFVFSLFLVPILCAPKWHTHDDANIVGGVDIGWLDLEKINYEIFNYEQTIVLQERRKSDSKLHKCEIFEVYKEEQARAYLDHLVGRFNVLALEPKKVDMKEMVKLIDECNSINEGTKEDDKSFWFRVSNKIVPTTNWCGKDNVAHDYHDLGDNHEVDKCCRAHDYCPIKVLGNNNRYNLTNNEEDTLSHCTCDEAFFNCLFKADGVTANLVGEAYFTILKPDCIKGVPEDTSTPLKFVKTEKVWPSSSTADAVLYITNPIYHFGKKIFT